MMISLLASLLLSIASAQDAEITPKARSLTLEEFIAIAATAVETDFEYVSSFN